MLRLRSPTMVRLRSPTMVRLRSPTMVRLRSTNLIHLRPNCLTSIRLFYMAMTKILYVEDEEVLAMLVRDHLIKNGFEVHWITQGQAAESLFQKTQPDLCILDVMLPGMSGFE